MACQSFSVEITSRCAEPPGADDAKSRKTCRTDDVGEDLYGGEPARRQGDQADTDD
jgi:hypothetical protein